MTSYSLSHLADHILLRELAALVTQDRATTAALLAHLAEVDERKLYLPAAYPSMFMYCVSELRMSEDSALKALTSNAAKMAGVSDRLGTVEKGRIANVLVTENGLFDDRMRVRGVFVSGWPVEMDAPAAPPATGRGRGGR